MSHLFSSSNDSRSPQKLFGRHYCLDVQLARCYARAKGSVAYRVKNSTKERTDKNTLTASKRFHTIWSPIFILRALHSIVSRDATARWVRAVGRPSDQGSVCFDEQGGAIKQLAHSRRRAEGEVRSDSFGGKKRMSRRDSRKFHLSKEAPK